MAFNINDIKATLIKGGARPTLFQCVITLPAAIPGNLNNISFLGRATQLPASNLGMIQIPYFGRKVKIAGDRTYDPWTVTIMNDEDFIVRDTLEGWNQRINSPSGNIRAGNVTTEAAYKADAQILQFDKNGNIIRTYNFRGIFPETISTIDLDWNANDQIEEFQVQFQYDYFDISGRTASSARLV